MVRAKFLIDVEVYSGLSLKKGEEYITSLEVMKQLLRIYPGGLLHVGDLDEIYKKLDIKSLKQGDEVFLFRSGGIGDVLFMLPILKYLKDNFEIKTKVATSPMYCGVLKNNPYIDKIIQMPFPTKEILESDFQLTFEGVIENSTESARTLCAIDLFLDHAGIDYKSIDSDDKVPGIYLSDKEILNFERKHSKFMRTERKKIGIQIEASSPIRTIPLEKVVEIIKALLDENYEVFAFGGNRQEQVGWYLKEIFLEEAGYHSLIASGSSLRDSILFASKMDLMIAPDSSFIHIAAGLGVPIVGLYGCFPSFLRMKYYKNAIGIDCNVGCAPSFLHGHNPCPKGAPSPCFSVIKCSDVTNAVRHLIGVGKRIPLLYPRFNEFIKGELSESSFNYAENNRHNS